MQGLYWTKHLLKKISVKQVMKRYVTLTGYAAIQQKTRNKACTSLQKYHHRRVNNQTSIIEHLNKNKGVFDKKVLQRYEHERLHINSKHWASRTERLTILWHNALTACHQQQITFAHKEFWILVRTLEKNKITKKERSYPLLLSHLSVNSEQ